MITIKEQIEMLEALKEELFDNTQTALHEQRQWIKEQEHDWDHNFEGGLILDGMESMQLIVLQMLDAKIEIAKASLLKTQVDAEAPSVL